MNAYTHITPCQTRPELRTTHILRPVIRFVTVCAHILRAVKFASTHSLRPLIKILDIKTTSETKLLMLLRNDDIGVFLHHFSILVIESVSPRGCNIRMNVVS